MVDVQKTSGGQPTQMDLTNSSAPQTMQGNAQGNKEQPADEQVSLIPER